MFKDNVVYGLSSAINFKIVWTENPRNRRDVTPLNLSHALSKNLIFSLTSQLMCGTRLGVRDRCLPIESSSQ